MKVSVGSDHGGFLLKQEVVSRLRKIGHTVTDAGAFSRRPSDYPDFARLVAGMIREKKAERGILICGSGVGACIAANKFPGIRASVCHDTFSARQGVEDDDMNLLCLGARVVGEELAFEVVSAFLSAKFSGLERHRRRLRKVLSIESGFQG